MGFFNDLFKPNPELLEWQRIITGSYDDNKLFYKKDQLVQMTVQLISDNMRIFDDSSKIVNSTIKPDVFFSRLELAEKCLARLKEIEPFLEYQNQFTFNEMPSALLEKFASEKQLYISNFLVRCDVAVKQKAEAMKTEKGKFNQYAKLKESLLPYMEYMNAGNRAYIDNIGTEL